MSPVRQILKTILVLFTGCTAGQDPIIPVLFGGAEGNGHNEHTGQGGSMVDNVPGKVNGGRRWEKGGSNEGEVG